MCVCQWRSVGEARGAIALGAKCLGGAKSWIFKITKSFFLQRERESEKKNKIFKHTTDFFIKKKNGAEIFF